MVCLLFLLNMLNHMRLSPLSEDMPMGKYIHFSAEAVWWTRTVGPACVLVSATLQQGDLLYIYCGLPLATVTVIL